MATDREESIRSAARAYADSVGHGDACDLTLYGACDMTLYGEEYRCDCGYAALRSALAQPAAPEAGSAGAMREACAIETDRILASWGYADDPDSVRAQVGARIRALPLPAPEATRAGENPWCYVVADADMRGWDGEYYKVKGAADGEAMVANKQVEVPGQWRVVPLYAHPTPPRAEGVERADRVVALEDSIRRWHHEKYGRAALIAPTVRKLGEEFGEFCEAAVKGDVPAMTEEAADVALILTNLVRAVGGGSLFDAMETKHEVCKQRLAAERGEG